MAPHECNVFAVDTDVRDPLVLLSGPTPELSRDDPQFELRYDRVKVNTSARNANATAFVLVTPPPSAAPRAVPKRRMWRRPTPKPSFSDNDADDSSVEALAPAWTGTGTEDDPVTIDP